MTKILTFIIGILFIIGFSLILNQPKDAPVKKRQAAEETDSKAATLKKYLLQFPKPLRVEIVSLSERYSEDIGNLKKLRVPQDPNSDYYMRIVLFTDEDDKSAPLIAQIRFIDVKTENLKKEESINLD